ncbi:hypothetical protein FRC19_003919 [Serendipita sp. 401]|nr:hypothetical protein FRC15_002479 [Serendipita sp. 397]KAG8827342.1 hypothetical protein FRC19_003919 [Serendipita sp. 401]KAG8875129.1 hypothetical protein FRC20_004454 [Serendipita sp. 405]KAG9057697.1 hypothetical protein FS842_004616 [Serendipita sp. 407]
MQRLLPLELSSIFFATRDVPRPITRYFHSLVNTDRIVYPTRLSLDGQQPIINHSAEDATFSRRIDPPTPGFSDHELKAIYRDLLRLDIETPDISFDKRIPDPAVVIPRLTRRLVSSSPKSLDEDIMSLSAKLKTRLSPIASQYPIEYHSEGKPYSAVLNALHTNSLIAPLPLLGIDMPVSLDIMKPLEWASLVDACLHYLDFGAIFVLFRAMKRSLQPIDPNLCHHVLELMSKEGLLYEIQAFFSEFMQDQSEEGKLPYLLTALCRCHLYSSAIQLLHSREAQGHIPSMKAYRALIVALLHSSGSGNAPRSANAWNLFYHMRYVAHPIPSVQLYTDMILACAEKREPDTLRGFDLWAEMTVDKRLPPSVESYNAVIMLAARGKDSAPEAIRLAKQMLEVGRDANGKPALRPNRETYLALLEAYKRLGDVRGARWALTRLATVGENGRSEIDTWALRHVFQTYGVYRPPFRKELANIKPKANPSKETQHMDDENDLHLATLYLPRGGNNDRILPQTSQSVIAEVDALFDRVVQAKQSQAKQSESGTVEGLFARVENLYAVAESYISAYFRHSSLPQTISKARAIHTLLDVDWSPNMIRMCLQHCAFNSKGTPTAQAIQFSDELWAIWIKHVTEVEHLPGRWISTEPGTPASRASLPVATLKPVVISKIWAAYIHLKTRAGELDSAMALVRLFHQKFPPEAARKHLCPDIPTNSLVSLSGERTLIKVIERATIDDDTVPPILVFSDMSSLHQALVQVQRAKDIDYLTFLLHAYAGYVRDRRGMNLHVGDVKEGWRGRMPMGNEEVAKARRRMRAEWQRKTGRLQPALPRRI